MNSIKKFAAAFAVLALTAAAQAAPVTFASATGELATNVTAETVINAGTTDTLIFTLTGYNSLDGQNFYEDDFSVSVNGDPVFKGTFNLGGGGNNVTFLQTAGTTFTFGANKTINFYIPVSSDDGLYTIDFHYASLTQGSGHAGFQGLGDEGWGVSNVAVVPEPTSVALMLAGLGMIGGLARRRRQG